MAALPESDIFDVEYWDLEQAKLARRGPPPPFAGEVALVTGAASGIGKACVDAFLDAGAAVVGLDLEPRSSDVSHERRATSASPATSPPTRRSPPRSSAGVRRFGGVDMLVLNAGCLPAGTPIDALCERRLARRR